jgi:hypothetical protein
MHDPSTVAFDIKNPFSRKEYPDTLITIWHCDPEKDGTDDSCGWFMRARHGDKNMLIEIQEEFDFNLKNNYWFDKEGKQIFSTIGTLVQMYKHAIWIYFKRNRSKCDRFMRKHLIDIIGFAENPIDCIGDTITNKWGAETSSERFSGLAGIVYADILRKERKWYQHPKWHIWHWQIQFNFLQGWFRKKENNAVSDDNLRETV